jgi:hypothetical protein
MEERNIKEVDPLFLFGIGELGKGLHGALFFPFSKLYRFNNEKFGTIISEKRTDWPIDAAWKTRSITGNAHAERQSPNGDKRTIRAKTRQINYGLGVRRCNSSAGRVVGHDLGPNERDSEREPRISGGRV